MTTFYMNMDLPGVGSSTDYVETINTDTYTLDDHDHVNTGASLIQDSVEWGSFDISTGYISSCGFSGFSNQTDNVEIDNTLYFKDDAYFRDGASNYVQLTSDGAVNLAGSYSGFYGNFEAYGVSVVFNDTDNVYNFLADSPPSLVFKDVDASSTSYMENIDIDTALEIESTTQMYFDNRFPSEDGLSFYVNNDGNFESIDITEDSTENTYIYGTTSLNPFGASNTVDRLYTQSDALNNSTTSTPLTYGATMGVEIMNGTLQWQMGAFSDGTTEYVSKYVHDFYSVYQNVLSNNTDAQGLTNVKCIWRGYITPTDTVLENSVSTDDTVKFIQFKLYSPYLFVATAYVPRIYFVDYNIAYTDSNVFEDDKYSFNLSCQTRYNFVCNSADALTRSSGYQTAAFGCIGFSIYDNSTGSYVTDFSNIGITLHLGIIISETTI